ncbi:MAG: ABC transporter ATP-binding protein [Bacilli bacterium]|nr:ABC transporter ATP-binding protein [Bacilli bacterium]MDD4733662.1 ABC transporter ATP-binding protein [Bacilli bacterium]
MNEILKIENLKKIYHTKDNEILAVKDFSITINKGEFIAIVGPSGCGKSTILSILANLEQKSDGRIIMDQNIKLGYMLQQDCLFNWRTIYNNCVLGLELNNELTEKNKKRVLALLNKYGLKDFINSHPATLSGGMRQRVALIRTLATTPDILLLDEPFSALDYQTRLAVSDDVYNIIKKEDKTTIMVTHDIAEAISMADKIIVLTKRPGEIKSIHNIELSEKSTPIANRKAKEFSYYYDLIWKEIDYHV